MKLSSENLELTADEQAQASSWALMQVLNWGTISASMEAGLLSDQVAQVWIRDAVRVIDRFPGLIPHIDQILKGNGVKRGYSPFFDRVLDEVRPTT